MINEYHIRAFGWATDGQITAMQNLTFTVNDVLKKLQIDVFEAVTAFAKEQDYDLILSQGVVYSSDRIDVTEGVLKKLSK